MLYDTGAAEGIFPAWSTSYKTDQEVWDAFKSRSANWVISSTSRYLAELPLDVAAMPIPPLGSDSYTLVSGWLWALSDPYPERREISLLLAEHLVDPIFLAEWNLAAGYLPVRPSSMDAWRNQTIRSLLSQLTLSAQSQPPNDVLERLGPILEDAVYNVISNNSSPAEAARKAVERLENP